MIKKIQNIIKDKIILTKKYFKYYYNEVMDKIDDIVEYSIMDILIMRYGFPKNPWEKKYYYDWMMDIKNRIAFYALNIFTVLFFIFIVWFVGAKLKTGIILTILFLIILVFVNIIM